MSDVIPDPEILIRRSTFLEDWGDTVAEALEPSDAIDDWERTSSLAAAASAYLEALEGLLLVRHNDAPRLAAKAAKAYVILGMPIGEQLRILFGLVDPFKTSANALLAGALGEATLGHDDSHFFRALQYPQQRFTVAATLLAHPATLREYRSGLRRLIDQLATRHPLTPVGPASLPMRRYTDTASALVECTEAARAFSRKDENGLAHKSLERCVTALDVSFQAVSAPHAASLEIARENRYLWERGLSPITFVDLGVIAIATGAFRFFAQVEALPLLEHYLIDQHKEDIHVTPFLLAQWIATTSGRDLGEPEPSPA